MGSPEATLASAEGVGTPEGVFEELSGTLHGWKRKVFTSSCKPLCVVNFLGLKKYEALMVGLKKCSSVKIK